MYTAGRNHFYFCFSSRRYDKKTTSEVFPPPYGLWEESEMKRWNEDISKLSSPCAMPDTQYNYHHIQSIGCILFATTIPRTQINSIISTLVGVNLAIN